MRFVGLLLIALGGVCILSGYGDYQLGPIFTGTLTKRSS